MKRTVLQRDTKRRAFLTAELVLTLPVLGLILFALFEFSLLLAARSAVVEAARTGARKATFPNVQSHDIENDVRMVLPPKMRAAATIRVHRGDHTGDPVTVTVTVPMHVASPDLLWPIGYRLRGRHLFAETQMVRE